MQRLLQPQDISSKDWQNWRWHTANSIVTLDALSRWINVTEDEANAISQTAGQYRWRVSPYYASLMDKDDSSCPIRLQAIPNKDELTPHSTSDIDPVGDIYYRKTNRVVHKYPDRAILLVTRACPVYCRHCTRKFHTTDKDGSYFREGEGIPFDEDLDYIASHPEIRDVLLTGGDPLIYSDQKLDTILRRLRDISHINIIRIGSRFPVLLPQRITDEFCEMVNNYHPVWFSTHFNHPKELSTDAIAACDRLLKHGIPVQNQTVLLKGVNDSIDVMQELMRGLLAARVRPYYLYHCDNVDGVSHFMTSVDVGRKIVSGLFGYISGFAVPRYVMATTLGKIPLEKSYVIENERSTTLENYEGKLLTLKGGLDGVPASAIEIGEESKLIELGNIGVNHPPKTEYLFSGTLGDSFIAFCKLYSRARGTPCALRRICRHAGSDAQIAEVARLFHNIEYREEFIQFDNIVEMRKYAFGQAARYINIFWDGNGRDNEPNDPPGFEFTEFPQLNLEPQKHSGNAKHIGIQLHSGSRAENQRGLDIPWIESFCSLIATANVDITIFGSGLGYDSTEIDSLNSLPHNVTNLVGGRFDQWVNGLAGVDFLIAPEGFAPFFALSQRIPCLVLYKENLALMRMPQAWRNNAICVHPQIVETYSGVSRWRPFEPDQVARIVLARFDPLEA